MIRIIIIGFFLSFLNVKIFSQGCLPEGITFTTQEQIDNFQTDYPGCTGIEGNVQIGVWPGNNGISNLNGLSVLNYINGNCVIGYNNYLQNLNGLENLTTIGLNLIITNNISLQNLSGLDNLTSIGKNLLIFENPLLSNLTGLESLVSVGEDLEIVQNDGLINLNGIDNLSYVGLDVNVQTNESLTSLSAFGNITSIGHSLIIAQNYALTNLNGLHNLASVGYQVSISNNTSLTSLSALENITSGLNWLVIQGNDALNSLTGLENFDSGSLNNLVISVNSQLSECDVLSICNFLENPTGNNQIAFNTTGCNSPEEVQEACLNSVEELSSFDALLLYPNPATFFITLTIQQGEPLEEVIICNHLGQKVLSAKPVSNTVDISDMKEGMYMVEVITNEGKYRTKLIKNN